MMGNENVHVFVFTKLFHAQAEIGGLWSWSQLMEIKITTVILPPGEYTTLDFALSKGTIKSIKKEHPKKPLTHMKL